MQELTTAAQIGELDPVRITEAAAALLDETIPAEAKAAFLAALARRGETPAEIAAFADAFLTRAVVPEIDRGSATGPMIDVCGTGGDKLDLFNVSTTTVFVLAACGVAVMKHGNRGITSKSGGADVLAALGIDIELAPDDCGRCLAEVGATFLFAPRYHPAFKAVAPARKILGDAGQRSIFNLLGPLLNPARPDYQLIGVFDPAIGPVFAEILPQLGRRAAWVVHGRTENGAGMDEISTLGPTTLWDAPKRVGATIEPSSLGLAAATLSDLRGGDAAENAAILTGILDGSINGPRRDIVSLNAAAGLVICGLATDLAAGLGLAREAIASGAALSVLKRWQRFS